MRRHLLSFIIGILSAGIPASARADTLFAANYFSGALTKIDSGSGTSAALGSTKVDGTLGLACDATGNLYVGMILGPIEKWDPSGHESVLTSVNKNVGELAVDASGNIFAINTNASTLGVQEFSPTGTLLRTVTPGSISAPRGLAVDASGNIFLGCHFAGTSVIEKITPAGTITIFATLVSPVTGLAFNPAGNLYAAAGSSIYAYAPSGTRTIFVPNGFATPEGLAFDRAGNLYVVVGAPATSIDEITPAGVISTLATTTSAQDLAIAPSSAVATAVVPTDTPTLPMWAIITLTISLVFAAGGGQFRTEGGRGGQ